MPRRGIPRLLGAVLEGVAKLEECKLYVSLKKITQIVEIALRKKGKKVSKNLKDRINKVIEFGVEQGILIKKNGTVHFVIGPRDIAILDRKMGLSAAVSKKKSSKKICKRFLPCKPCKNKKKMKTKKESNSAKCKADDNKKKRGRKKKKEECHNTDTDSNDEEEDPEYELSESCSLASDLISNRSEPKNLEDDILDWIHNKDFTNEPIKTKECQSDKIKNLPNAQVEAASASTKTANTNSKKSVSPLSNERGDDYSEDNSDEKMHLDEDDHELEDMNDYEDDEDDFSSMEEDMDQDMETDIGMMDSDSFPCSPIYQHRFVQDYIHTNGKSTKEQLKGNKRTTQYCLGVIQGKVSKQYQQKRKTEKSRSRIREPAAGAELLGADPDPLNHPLILDYYRNGRFKSSANPLAVTSKKSLEKKGNGSKCELI